jgi:hypothetical protein
MFGRKAADLNPESAQEEKLHFFPTFYIFVIFFHFSSSNPGYE